jgi:hypothetical protein
MDRAEALKRLALHPTATRDEADAAWREAMKVVHPDSGSAPDEAMARILNEARDVASGRTSQALVPIEAIGALITTLQASQATAGLEKASDKAVTQVVTHHVGELAHIRRGRAGVAVVGGGLAAITAVLRATAVTGVLTTAEAVWWAVGIAALGVLSASFGVAAWALVSREQLLQLEVEDASDALSDKSVYVDALDEIGLGQVWTRNDLTHAVARWIHTWASGEGPYSYGEPDRHAQWFRTLARLPLRTPSRYRRLRRRRGQVSLAETAYRVGPVDFTRLMVTKGLESGLLAETSFTDQDGRRRYGFEVHR